MADTPAPYTITYWQLPQERIILKRMSDTLVNQVQVKGNNLRQDFHHNWEKVTFPTKERLDKHIQDNGFTPCALEEYDNMLADYFSINEEKRNLFNQDRQRRYDSGTLKL
jgi:hypothetical protein